MSDYLEKSKLYGKIEDCFSELEEEKRLMEDMLDTKRSKVIYANFCLDSIDACIDSLKKYRELVENSIQYYSDTLIQECKNEKKS